MAENQAAAHAAVAAFLREHGDGREQVIYDLITSLLAIAPTYHANAGIVLEQAQRRLMQAAAESEADIVKVTARLRVVSYTLPLLMDRTEVMRALRAWFESARLHVADEDGAEELAPWVELDEIELHN
ncbi:hypothetical protein [Marinactinospora rubrisoli]|uniref:Uncharacterized protein n=1 Tax=Marinactinospora rubrisoli TaxID=2715399 RepID=A0ABW2KQ46_9ACTN